MLVNFVKQLQHKETIQQCKTSKICKTQQVNFRGQDPNMFNFDIHV